VKIAKHLGKAAILAGLFATHLFTAYVAVDWVPTSFGKLVAVGLVLGHATLCSLAVAMVARGEVKLGPKQQAYIDLVLEQRRGGEESEDA
jgi:hypothetical protein